MASIWKKKLQKAQGMVEFALVLPILLLVILGIIGFGHLFFTYSSVVTASREAARFGSAVGVTASGVPRYQDCAAIRGSAVNVGRLAGVTNTNVNITYDKGPGTALLGTDCSGSTGPDVELGDRIIVSITVNYRSIVPIVNIPSFPLTATTRRTIVRSLQVGEAPTAEAVCPPTNVYLNILGEDSATHTTHSVVGQPVPIVVSVAANNPPHPTTANGLYLFDSTLNPPVWPQQVFNAPSGTYTYTYEHAGNYLISGQYVGDIVQCFDDSALSNQLHVVDAATTQLQFLTPINNASYTVNTPVLITVSIGAVSPGARIGGWAGVDVSIRDRNNAAYTCTATLDATGTGTCSITFTSAGPVALDASFVGDTDYKLSTAAVDINITAVVPTLITPQITPSNTPSTCPTYSNFQTVSRGGSFSIRNNSGSAMGITQLVLRWPVDPIAQIQEIDLGNGHIYNSNSGTNPPVFTIGNGSSIISKGSFTANQTQTLSFQFSNDMDTVHGTYTVDILFSNNCTMNFTYTR